MSRRRLLAMRLGGAVLILSAVALVYTLVVDDAGNNGSDPSSTPSPDEYQTYVDDHEGFAISYPPDWVQATARNEDPNVKLLITPPGTEHAVSVSTISFDEPVTVSARTSPELVAALEAQLDQTIDQIPNITELVQRRRIAVGDVQGWTYIYRFQVENEPVGVHVKHFLFRGHRLYTLTFQAFPQDRYPDLAPTFDEILASFEFLDAAPPSPAPTGSPAATDPPPSPE